ncbi:hypothetical protein [Nocardia sp. alder85J]|uniref:hypothetical protein n=1 Tax=Nocardia sp. alder85J TaxID=2862949 RepID=UPI001CD71B2B|nr:hypothetical protein [Nocardia sp. alder85J]MCX4095342.1 hypothetical protein [Nocardia sp. alder85J]
MAADGSYCYSDGGLLGRGVFGRWPNYSFEEQDLLAELEQADRRYRHQSAWAARDLSIVTASIDNDPGEILPRWREYGGLIVRAERHWREIERRILAQLQTPESSRRAA